MHTNSFWFLSRLSASISEEFREVKCCDSASLKQMVKRREKIRLTG